MKRIFDLLMSLILIILLILPMFIISIAIKITSVGPILYWSDRTGKYNCIFKMPKFRTMRTDTPETASHLLSDPSAYVTPVGKFLRKSSLDEIPQLWSIIKGDMSFVGPRPALYNQYDLISARTALGIQMLTPGITGWAQINGRDDLSLEQKIKFDYEYLQRRSFIMDLYIILVTFYKCMITDGVSH